MNEHRKKRRVKKVVGGAILASLGAAAVGAVLTFGTASATPLKSDATAPTLAQQEADAASGTAGGVLPLTVSVPMSGQDRVYTTDQTSNTVTVIDPATDKVLGTIALGSQRLSSDLSPQYLGDIDVHGLIYSPGHQRIAAVSVASNTVDIIDTATNKVISHTDVGRSPHEGWFTQDGNQFWVADRGRDTVTIVDAVHGGVITNLHVGDGPSKVVMSPDGKWAYINHINLPEITVVNVATHAIVGQITGLAATFSSDLAITPDGKQLWVPHKHDNKVTVVDLVHDKVVTVLNTGPDTNHPNFSILQGQEYAYVTVGGLDVTKVYRVTTGAPQWVTDIHTTGEAPHPLWTSGDSTRLYVAHEKSDSVDVIDTATNKVIDTLAIGQEPNGLVYVPDAVPAGTTDADTPNLGTQGLGQQGYDVPTTLPDGSSGETTDPVLGKHLEANIRPVNGLDQIELEARSLQPNTTYAASSVAADGSQTPIVTFTTDAQGGAPMVLAFTKFTGVSIALKVAGSTDRPTSSTGNDTTAGSGTHAVTAADLYFCCCC
jgi:YVTN family beta-propeller protein